MESNQMDGDQLHSEFIGLKSLVEAMGQRIDASESKCEQLSERIDTSESNHKRLSTRIKQLEIQDLQNQISSIHGELLEVARYLARHNVGQWDNHLHDSIYRQFANHHTHPTYLAARDFLTSAETSVKKDIKISLKPLDDADKYVDACFQYFKKHELRGFAN